MYTELQMLDKRAEKRRKSCKKLRYREGDTNVLRGIQVNATRLGILLYTHKKLRAHQIITIYFPREAPKRGVIRWTESMDSSSFKTGVEFMPERLQ